MKNNFRKTYGPWALVLGASEGLGAAFSIELAEKGCNIIAVARRQKQLDDLCSSMRKKHAIETLSISLDLGDESSIDLLNTQTRKHDIGLIVINAAFAPISPVLDSDRDDLLRVVDLNCRAMVSVVHTFGRRLKARGEGGLILLSSMASLQGSSMICTYSASKAFIRVFAEGLWNEFQDYGLDVIACLPGPTSTPGYNESVFGTKPPPFPAKMDPIRVAKETLAGLGKKPVIVPGKINAILSFFMRRILPKKWAIGLVSANARRAIKGKN